MDECICCGCVAVGGRGSPCLPLELFCYYAIPSSKLGSYVSSDVQDVFKAAGPLGWKLQHTAASSHLLQHVLAPFPVEVMRFKTLFADVFVLVRKKKLKDRGKDMYFKYKEIH